MARTKKAARSHKQHAGGGGGGCSGGEGGGGGGGGGAEGRSPKKKKKQPQNTNKQSAKQRIRAEAAERSRLSRKANKALQRRVEREEAETAAAAAAESPGPGPAAAHAPHASSGGEKNSALAARSPASRAEQREAVQQDVEARLSVWRRKRARAEAGLPDDPRDTGHNNNNPERSNFFPTAYYPEQAGGGGGRAPTAGGAVALPGGSRSGSEAMVRQAWPDVYNAPVRRCLPGHGRSLLGGSSSSAGGNSGGGGGGGGKNGGVRKDRRSEETRREAEELWEAPWMLGLVPRGGGRGGGAAAGGGGSFVEPVDLLSSDEEDDQVENGVLAGEAVEQRGSEGRDANAVQLYGGRGGGNEARHAGPGSSERGAGGAASADEGLSDLHHELLRFEEYVSLTPAEVRAREGLVASIEMSAGEALGHGATARAFGSYGGARAGAQSDCFSIFLSDVDISVRPPADPGVLPPQGQELPAAKPPSARTTLGGFLDLSRGSDDGFEEGSSSSSAEASLSSPSSSSSSSSSEGSTSDSDAGSDSGSDSDSSSRPSRSIPVVSARAATAAAAAAKGEAIYVASSGSEADDREERPLENRRSRSTEKPPHGVSAAATDIKTETETSVSCGGGGGGGGGGDDDRGPGGRRVGTVESPEKAGKEQQPGTDKIGRPVATEAEKVLGFYVDCRPDPELLKLVAKEREAADASSKRGAGEEDECSAPGQCLGEEFNGGGSGSGAGGVGRRYRPPTETKPVSPGPRAKLEPEPVEEAPQTRREAAPASEPSRGCEGEAGGDACDDSFSSYLSPNGKGKGKGKGKKRPRSPSPSSMRSLGGSAGGGGGGTGDGKRLSMEASGDDGDIEGGGRLRVVYNPDRRRWVFVKDEVKGSDNDTDPPGGRVGGDKEEEEEGEDEDNTGAKNSATSSDDVQQKDESSGASGPAAAAAALDDMAAAASGPGETAAQVAERLRAESERTARLTADAATLLSSAGVDRAGAASGRSTAALPLPPASGRLASEMGGGDVEGGSGGGGGGARSHGSKNPADPVEGGSGKGGGKGKGKGTAGNGGDTKGDGNDGGDWKGEGQRETSEGEGEERAEEEATGEEGEGEEEVVDGEVKHDADGLMALVREQERRNRGGSLPPAFVSAANGQGQRGGRPGETSSRAARLQAALTVAAGAAAKHRLSSGTVAPPGGALEIRARPQLANGGGGGGAAAGVPWRGGQAGAKARAVAGLRKLGKRLLKNPWVEKYEFRTRAKVPIIAMLDARGGVECDVGWGGDDGRDDPADAPGPTYFADMFPGTFRPLALFLKVFMRQRGLDKPFTGGLGSFKLYALIASHLEVCGCERAQQQQRDLGDLLLSFFRRYSPASKERISPTTVLRIKGLTVDLGSAFRAPVASKDFSRAFEVLSSAVEEASHAADNIRTAAPGVSPGPPPCEKSSDGGRLKGKKWAWGKSRRRQPEHEHDVHQHHRRSSVLGRVVWGSDLRRERESRLAAVGCAKTSPRPVCPEPHWHVKLEATYHPNGGAGAGAGQRDTKSLSGRFPRLTAPPRSHRPTSAAQGHAHAHVGGGGLSKSHRFFSAAKPRGGGGGGHGGGGGGGANNVQKPKKPPWTKAQKKRAKLKRDAEEIEMRKHKKGGPNPQAARAAGAKSKSKPKKRKAGTAGGTTGRKKMKLPGF